MYSSLHCKKHEMNYMSNEGCELCHEEKVTTANADILPVRLRSEIEDVFLPACEQAADTLDTIYNITQIGFTTVDHARELMAQIRELTQAQLVSEL